MSTTSWATEWMRQHKEIFGQKVGRFFPSVLHSAAKLRYGDLPRTVATGNMPSSSSGMAIAPVGIVNAGHPRAAAAQAAFFCGNSGKRCKKVAEKLLGMLRATF